MANRSALLIHCPEEDLQKVRHRAGFERRTVSAYVLNIVMRMVAFDEKVFSSFIHGESLRILLTQSTPASAPKTTMLLRCSADQAQRIRAAAKQRNTTISAFVLQALHRSWNAAEGIFTARADTLPQGTQDPAP